ncbi:MAG: YkgJ family cysteine cluster protein [Lachnospiraceae bacterium]|nr:YkgJ family cysteine cluster protein [Lachnospiraceae bacterium]
MKRNLDFEDISDGKRYSCDSQAPVGTHGCSGCCECCKNTEDTIFLDAYDFYSLQKATGKTFETLMNEGVINLQVSEGLIVPYLMKKGNGSCIFLSENERCNIHEYRPGFCRMFPLGRIWNDDGSFDYFLQVHECPVSDKELVTVKDWIGIPSFHKYEKFVIKWHELCNAIKLYALKPNHEHVVKSCNMQLLNRFFVEPYDTSKDFYEQFWAR